MIFTRIQNISVTYSAWIFKYSVKTLFWQSDILEPFQQLFLIDTAFVADNFWATQDEIDEFLRKKCIIICALIGYLQNIFFSIQFSTQLSHTVRNALPCHQDSSFSQSCPQLLWWYVRVPVVTPARNASSSCKIQI